MAMSRRRALGAVLAALGGACWLVKSVGILVTGEQVPLLIEAGPPLFGAAALAMALAPYDETGLRATSLGAAVVALAAGVVSFVDEVLDGPLGASIAVSSVALLVALVALGLRSPRGHRWGVSTPHQVALVLGVGSVPAIAVGGALAVLGERPLEVPIAVLGLLWIALGALMWTTRDDGAERSQGQVFR